MDRRVECIGCRGLRGAVGGRRRTCAEVSQVLFSVTVVLVSFDFLSPVLFADSFSG